MLDLDDLVLIVLKGSDGRVEGRTRLQKLAFFVSEILGVEAGFEPHIYGPYSSPVRSVTEAQVSRGIVSEERKPWSSRGFSGHDLEQVRYDHALTEAGERALQLRQQRDPSDFQRAEELVRRINSTGADYQVLSWAAKLYWILAKERGKPVPLQVVQKEAEQLGWHMSPEDMQKGIELLKSLQLVTMVPLPAGQERR